MNWYLEDLSLWPHHLPVRYAEVVTYTPPGQQPRKALVMDTAPSDPDTDEDRVMVEFYDDGDSWVLPVSVITSTGRLDRERAGPWVYPTLGDGSIVKVRTDASSVLAETLGLWCTDRRVGMEGYRVRPVGKEEVIFAKFDDLQMP